MKQEKGIYASCQVKYDSREWERGWFNREFYSGIREGWAFIPDYHPDWVEFVGAQDDHPELVVAQYFNAPRGQSFYFTDAENVAARSIPVREHAIARCEGECPPDRYMDEFPVNLYFEDGRTKLMAHVGTFPNLEEAATYMRDVIFDSGQYRFELKGVMLTRSFRRRNYECWPSKGSLEYTSDVADQIASLEPVWLHG